MLDYELELGCVIGREGRDVAEADAMPYIAGFCIFNDWSCRDIQRDESAVGLGPAKGKDSASSLGPWLVTTDELAPLIRDGRLQVKCSVRVNGEVWLEDSDGGVPYHTWGSLVERASKDSRIAPGDVFGSGTVGGGSIGEAIRKGYPGARFLQPGDVVEHEVEGIGTLRATIGPKGKRRSQLPLRAQGTTPSTPTRDSQRLQIRAENSLTKYSRIRNYDGRGSPKQSFDCHLISGWRVRNGLLPAARRSSNPFC